MAPAELRRHAPGSPRRQRASVREATISKGDGNRNWAYKLPPVAYAEKIDAIDWTAPTTEPESVRVCIECKVPKPEGKWCATCDRHTASERVYLEAQPPDEWDDSGIPAAFDGDAIRDGIASALGRVPRETEPT